MLELILPFAIGGLTGYLIAKALKAMSGAIALALGLFLLGVFALWNLGVLNVNWYGLEELLKSSFSWISQYTENVPLSLGSFGVGFILGAGIGFAKSVSPRTRYFKKEF